MAADAATIRQWLNDNGRPQSEHGRISKDDRDFYNAVHSGPDFVTPPDDVDAGVSDADFSGDDEEPSVPMGEEQQPRSGRRARTRRTARTRTERIAGKLLGDGPGKTKAKTSRARKAPPRVSLEKFVTRSWTMLGRMSASVSQPLGNCLQAQAPMAGVILEDIARGTVADRLLQPVARAEDRLDKVFALVAPPVLVLGIDMSNGLPPAEAAARQAILVPMLRESLRVSLEVTEAYAEQITERLAQNLKYDEQVDKLIAAIFGQVQAEAEEPEPATMGA
jgi:hypothetical protein